MPTTLTRELSITYGSLTVYPDAGPEGGDQYRVTENFDSFILEFAFLVTGTDASSFAAACSAARTAFRKPFQALTMSHGGVTLYSFSHTGNTGLEIKSEILKEDSFANSFLLRRFRVRITAGLPADNVTTAGLREYSVSVGYSPARRRLVTISGVFTANASTQSRAAYEGAIATLASAVKSQLSITAWELTDESPTAQSYNDQTLSFSRSYHEILYGQGGSGDDAAIVEQQLRITRRQMSERNAPSSVSIPVAGLKGQTSDGGIKAHGGRALPLLEVSATYECWIDFGSLSGVSALNGKWTSIRSFVLGQMTLLSGGGSYAVTSEDVSVSPDDNRISANLTIAIAPASGVLRREFSVEVTKEAGYLLVPGWNGNSLGRFVYQGPRRFTATYRMVEELAGGGTSITAPTGGESSGGSSGGGSLFGADFGGLFGYTGGFPTFGGGGEYQTGIGAGTTDFPNSNSGSGSSSGSGVGSTPSVDAGGFPSDSVVISDTKSQEPTEYGVEAPLSFNKTTYTRILEYFNVIDQPVGYSAGGTTS